MTPTSQPFTQLLSDRLAYVHGAVNEQKPLMTSQTTYKDVLAKGGTTQLAVNEASQRVKGAKIYDNSASRQIGLASDISTNQAYLAKLYTNDSSRLQNTINMINKPIPLGVRQFGHNGVTGLVGQYNLAKNYQQQAQNGLPIRSIQTNDRNRLPEQYL